MTVGELRELLENFDDEMEVVMQPCNSMYVDGIDNANIEDLRPFYGTGREVLVLTSSGQEGAV